MNYPTFLLKKGLKSILVLLSVALTIIVVLTCLFFNLHNQHKQTFESHAQAQISYDINQKSHYTAGDIKRNAHHEISTINDDMQMNKGIKELLHQRNWRKAYKKQIAYNNWVLSMSPNNGAEVTKYFRESLISQIFLCKALIKLNIADQSTDSPTTGTSFFLYIDDLVSSVLIILLVIFICSQLYTKRFARFLDKDTLLPISLGKRTLANLFSGYTLAVTLALLVIGFSFLSATSISGIGNWHYPFPYYTSQFPFNIYQPQSEFVIPTIILRILSSCFAVTCVYFFAILTKKALITLLLNLLILIGTNQLTDSIKLLSKIGQYLPTSYFNGVSVSSGRLAFLAKNPQIDMIHGIAALISWTILLGLAAFGIQYVRQRQRT